MIALRPFRWLRRHGSGTDLRLAAFSAAMGLSKSNQSISFLCLAFDNVADEG